MGQIGYTGDESPLGKTSSADLRRWLRALYVNSDTNPIMAGGDIIGRPDRAYGYTDGVGCMQVGNGSVILTWPAGQTALVSQPSTPRTDVIYCDASGAVRVGTEGVVPENDVIVIRKMAAPAGMTATTQAVAKFERNWAMPYGAQHGWLNSMREFHEHGTPVTKAQHIVGNLPFRVTTKRDMTAEVHMAIYADHNPLATDFAAYAPGAMLYQLFLDNVLQESWEMEYNRVHRPQPHTVWLMGVNDGEHTARLERRHAWGSNPLHIGGTVDKFARGFFAIIDRGVGR